MKTDYKWRRVYTTVHGVRKCTAYFAHVHGNCYLGVNKVTKTCWQLFNRDERMFDTLREAKIYCEQEFIDQLNVDFEKAKKGAKK